MKSLKGKLILGISLFIVMLLTVSAILQVREKQKELINDIMVRSRSYAELTAEKLVDDYKLYLVPDSFVYFNRNFQSVLSKNEDISWIKIAGYDGQIMFDSTQDKEQKYTGSKRFLDDEILLQQIQSKNLSVRKPDKGDVVYFKKKPTTGKSDQSAESFQAVGFNEKPVAELAQDQKIDYLVMPAGSEYSVIYGISYDALQARVNATIYRILILAVFGVALGVLLSIVFGWSITKPLAVLKEGTEIFAKGDLTHRVVVNTDDEIHDLAMSFNNMAEQIQENTKALVYEQRVAKELELATQIQSQIIPTIMPRVSGLDIEAGIIPAEEIGGDCYDFMQPDSNSLLFYLGDVTGHGVPAGIVVSIANALIYSFSRAGNKQLEEIVHRVNEVMKEKTTPNMFITLVLMKWLIQEQQFTYVSAGHEQIIHYIAKEDKVVLLPSGGLALGMIMDIRKLLKVQQANLEKNDVLMIYSDGIPEAWRNEKEMYGMPRLMAKVKEYATFDTALDIKMALMADVYAFREGYKQMDDITCIIVKRN